MAVHNGFMLGLSSVAISAGCFAQTGAITVTQSDPTGIVLPGETIRVTVTRSWSISQPPIFLARLAGDAVTTPSGGVISGLSSPYVPSPPFATVTPGVIVGGGVLGMDIEFPLHPVGVAPGAITSQWGAASVEVMSFDWTAPSVGSPTAFDFGWHADPAHPLLEVWSAVLPTPFAIPTNYVGTSVLVVPAPAASGVLLLAGLAAGRRRR